MRLVATALGAIALAVGAATASAQMAHGDHGMGRAAAASVSMSIASYGPTNIDVLVGDTVHWSNASIRVHTISAEDGSWSSPRLFANDTFDHRFDRVGAAPYYCKLHTFMRGVVDVHRIVLATPKEPGAPGRPYALHGRAALPAGSEVAVEADTGAGFRRAATATVGADGAFEADVAPQASASYRAVAGGEASPSVQLLVLDRKLAARAHTSGRRVTVSTSVAPASPGATVVLQLRLKERFGWWPVARAKVDRHSRATFSLRLGHRYPARVVLTLADGATHLALSRTLHVGPR
jgi:plastocyanin